jgi:Flp pilus assembly protein TadG
MKWMHCRTRATGTSLVEFALVLPVLVLLVIGGMSLFVRNLYRNSLDAAAEQAAWAAARTGGDRAAVQSAVERAIPFVRLEELAVSATSTGYHAEVTVTVSYVARR